MVADTLCQTSARAADGSHNPLACCLAPPLPQIDPHRPSPAPPSLPTTLAPPPVPSAQPAAPRLHRPVPQPHCPVSPCRSSATSSASSIANTRMAGAAKYPQVIHRTLCRPHRVPRDGRLRWLVANSQISVLRKPDETTQDHADLRCRAGAYAPAPFPCCRVPRPRSAGAQQVPWVRLFRGEAALAGGFRVRAGEFPGSCRRVSALES